MVELTCLNFFLSSAWRFWDMQVCQWRLFPLLQRLHFCGEQCWVWGQGSKLDLLLVEYGEESSNRGLFDWIFEFIWMPRPWVIMSVIKLSWNSCTLKNDLTGIELILKIQTNHSCLLILLFWLFNSWKNFTIRSLILGTGYWFHWPVSLEPTRGIWLSDFVSCPVSFHQKVWWDSNMLVRCQYWFCFLGFCGCWRKKMTIKLNSFFGLLFWSFARQPPTLLTWSRVTCIWTRSCAHWSWPLACRDWPFGGNPSVLSLLIPCLSRRHISFIGPWWWRQGCLEQS